MGLWQNLNEDVNGNAFINLQDGSGNAITSTNVSGKQGLDVNIISAIMIGEADKSAYTYGTSTFQPVGGVFQDTAPSLAAGQAGAFRLTADRAVHVNLRDAAGNPVGDTNADGIWTKIGDGTNAGSFSATSEQFVQLRQGGNVADVNASNQLLVLDGNAGSILALMKPATATLTQVTLSTSSQSVLASNANRKGMMMYNQSNKIIYIAFGATATAVAFTVAIQPNGYAEWCDDRVYTGALSVIGAAGVSGSLAVTELT